MTLFDILNGVVVKGDYDNNAEIDDIAYDSRKAAENTLFVCLPGARFDGHDFAKGAYDRGCRYFLCEKQVYLPEDAVLIFCSDTRAALAVLSCNFFKNPSREIKVIGVTGTKGKTTCTHIIKNILDKGGIKTGIIGTVGAGYGDITLPTVNTTPESYELQKMLRIMADAGCKAAAIEVSSLGLKHHRVDGVKFDTAVFTNFYEDHIGTNEHKDMEEYAFWKKQLFFRSEKAIINTDDELGKEIFDFTESEKYSYGKNENANYIIGDTKSTRSGNILGIEFPLTHNGQADIYDVSLPGKVNAYNTAAAIITAELFGVSDEIIKSSLKRVTVKGRGEFVDTGRDFSIVIDYAHNGVSLESIIETVKGYEHNRIIALYGSVGGRTEVRRRELGTVAGKMCDLSIITSDDPDFEDPDKIISEIAAYVEENGGKHVDIADREEAIRYALSIAQKGDIIILAGKGHEDSMKIRGQNVPFSEKEIIKKYL